MKISDPALDRVEVEKIFHADPRVGLFDAGWYSVKYRLEPSVDAWEHWRTWGWQESKWPHPLFDVGYYLAQTGGGLEYGDDPVNHYVREGADRSFSPHPLFDPKFYARRYAVEIGDVAPFRYFTTRGWVARHNPSLFFDTAFYLQQYEDVAGAEINPLYHYAEFGAQEYKARRPSASFDTAAYVHRMQLPPGVNPLAHLMARWRKALTRPAPTAEPDTSIIVLNYNKAAMTIECVVTAVETTVDDKCEIIVVDNGSRAEEFTKLAEGLPAGVRLIRLTLNRFFGEGNNIGAEEARGRFLLFLNNDAFLQPGTVSQLLEAYEQHPDAGSIGPKFLYPDGLIQEAGGFAFTDGSIVQRGKFLDNDEERYRETSVVDYVSAACLLVRKNCFDFVGGFDLAYEPAYYEDVDLCLKLAVAGHRTYYCGAASVVHIEGGTSGDAALNLRLHDIVRINREKFMIRWSQWLHNREVGVPRLTNSRSRPSVSPADRLAVVYTPYPLIPGGGERYILSIVQALAKKYRTLLVTPERYSAHRLQMMGVELDLDLAGVNVIAQAQLPEVGGCEIFLAMGNELLPALRGIGQRRLFVCQFPFPMSRDHIATAWNTLDTYDTVVVYSQFVARELPKQAAIYGIKPPPIHVLSPPVPAYPCADGDKIPGRILHVGRFTSEGHSKRQDILIDVFKDVVDVTGRMDLELNLVGVIGSDPLARAYFTRVREAARGYRVKFHLNAPSERVAELYRSASVYWHATGAGQATRIFPERMEHFGISVLESMSAGAVAMAFASGGPMEIIEDRVNGYLWSSRADLQARFLEVLNLSQAELAAIRRAARSTAARFEIQAFNRNLDALLYGDAQNAKIS